MLTTILAAFVFQLGTSQPSTSPSPQDNTSQSSPQGSAQASPAKKVSAAELLSALLDRYHKAKTLVGDIKLTQTAQGKTVTTETVLAYERPYLLHIEQKRDGAESGYASIVCDGNRFAYTRPDNLKLGAPKLIESAKHGGEQLTIDDLYSPFLGSILDRSPILEVALNRPIDLKYFVGQLASLKYIGKVKLRGSEVHEVAGKWREIAEKPASGDFELYIDSNGDLVRYVLRQFFAFPPEWYVQNHLPVPESTDPIEVISAWDAEIKVNGPVDPSLFRLR